MTILEAIRAAVKAGGLEQPFTAEEVAEALREHFYSRGSIAVILARYSRPGPAQPNPPLRRIARGLYQLATRSPKRIAAASKRNKGYQ